MHKYYIFLNGNLHKYSFFRNKDVLNIDFRSEVRAL